MGIPWRVVWITGASTGIGAEIALQLAQAGVVVAASARSIDKLEALAIRAAAIKPYPLDVTDPEACKNVFNKITSEQGQIDLVIAGAATYQAVSAADISPSSFDTMYRTNYLGVINVLSAVLPSFRVRRNGHISWIASVAGYRGLPKAAAYGPTKAALINLAESLKPELERDGVTISVVNPGFVRTPMTAKNDFEMPFLMEPVDAAAATIAGLAKKKFEVAYPTPFVVILKLVRILPYRAFFWLVHRFVLKS